MFDKVLKPNCTQDYVYSAAAKSIVKGKEETQSGSFRENPNLTGFFQMCLAVITAPFLLTVRPPPEKPTPWKASSAIQAFKVFLHP